MSQRRRRGQGRGRYTAPKIREEQSQPSQTLQRRARWRLNSSDPNVDFFDLSPPPPPLMRAVAPIVVRRNEEMIGLGTAFCVATFPNRTAIFMTAGHILDDMLDLGKGSQGLVLLPSGDQLFDVANELHGCNIVEGDRSADVDAGIVLVKLEDQVEPPSVMALSLGRPVIGNRCLAIGFPELTPGEPLSPNVNELRLRASTSRGRVREVHPTRRDVGLISFPCFMIDALIPDGLSGGPVLNADAKVIGVAAAGMELDAGDETPHTSYATLLGAFCELSVGLPFESPDERTVSVGDLFGSGQIRSDGTRCKATRDDDGLTISWPKWETPKRVKF